MWRIKLGIVIAIIGISVFAKYQYDLAIKYRNLYSTEKENTKAYNQELSNDKSKAIVFQQSMSDLKNSNDSLIQEALRIKKELNIKDKNVSGITYQTATITKRDTIKTKDTIFVNTVNIDTTVTDGKWYSLNLKLKYPNIISVKPVYKSELFTIINTKRETINQPSKVFFIKWFQKKQTVVYVNIKENNPYININEQKFIKVIQ